jgi:sarcosine oxidase delta subunit
MNTCSSWCYIMKGTFSPVSKFLFYLSSNNMASYLNPWINEQGSSRFFNSQANTTQEGTEKYQCSQANTTQEGTEKYQCSSGIVTSNLMLQKSKIFWQPKLAKLMWKTWISYDKVPGLCVCNVHILCTALIRMRRSVSFERKYRPK